MKIVITHPLLDPSTGGGMAEKAPTLARAFRQAGAECMLLGTNAGLSPTRAASLADLDLALFPALASRFNLPLASRHAVARALHAADIILVLNHWSVLNTMVANAARAARTPYVVLPGGALPAGDRSRRLKQLFNRWGGTRLVQNASGHVATTVPEVAEFLPYGITPDRVTVIPNAVSSDGNLDEDVNTNGPAQEFRRAHGLGEAPFVLFSGRLHTIKGPDLLLEAFARVAAAQPDLQLVYAGADDGLRAALEGRIGALGLQTRVRLIGYQERRRVNAAYRAAALVVVPSRREAMSLVALEAGAAGTPVLITETSGFPEIEAVDGGRVVPPTVDGLTAGLRDLFSNRNELRARGQRLRALVQSRYTWERVVEQYFELFRHILRERRG